MIFSIDMCHAFASQNHARMTSSSASPLRFRLRRHPSFHSGPMGSSLHFALLRVGQSHSYHIIPSPELISAFVKFSDFCISEMLVEFGTVFRQVFILFRGISDAGIQIENAISFSSFLRLTLHRRRTTGPCLHRSFHSVVPGIRISHKTVLSLLQPSD